MPTGWRLDADPPPEARGERPRREDEANQRGSRQLEIAGRRVGDVGRRVHDDLVPFGHVEGRHQGLDDRVGPDRGAVAEAVPRHGAVAGPSQQDESDSDGEAGAKSDRASAPGA